MFKKLRYILEALLLILVMGVSKCLPSSTASNLGGWIGRTIGPRLAASRKAMRNLTKIYPDKSEDEKQKILTDMWDNLGRVMMEYPHIKTIAKHKTTIHNFESLKPYKGQSIIFIAAHLGNWEICPPAFALQHSFIADPMYRPPNNPFSDWILNKARTLGNTLNPIPKSKAGTKQLLETLREGKNVGILIDQKYNEGIAMDFMGQPAMTTPSFAQLAQKFNAPIVPLQIMRKDKVHFDIVVHAPIDIKSKDTEDIIEQAHTHLENWINDTPGQWLWLHRRWKDF